MTSYSFGGLLALFLIALVCIRHELPRWKAKGKRTAQKKRASLDREAREHDHRQLRESVIAEAKTLPLPDAMFAIVCHNRNLQHTSWRIDPFPVFPDENPAIVAGWEKKSEQLLSMGQRVGMSVDIIGHGNILISEQNLVEFNPGFSEQVYARAISLGIRVARPDI